MAISSEYINGLLEEYASSAEGKKKIKDVYGIDYIGGKEQNKFYKKAGEDMVNILFKHINGKIASFDKNGIIVSAPVIKNNSAVVALSFTEDSLFRESLYPEGYPKGAYNIVLLFAHGYGNGVHVKGRVHGEWHGVETWNKTTREPSDFLEQAVSEFNVKYSGKAIAVLKNKYKK